jgi:hypothetical protein
MILCNWIIVCQQSIANQETDNISLIEVLEEISIPPPPEKGLFLNIDLDIVTSWRKGGNQQDNAIHKIQFKIIAPSGEVLLQGEPAIQFSGTSRPQGYWVFKLNGLPISGAGDYKFQIKVFGDDDIELQEVETLLQVNYEQVEDQLENSSTTQFNSE